MNDKKQAAADLKRLVPLLRGILSLGDELDKLGSMEQAAEESETRLRLLASQRTEAEAALAAEKQKFEVVSRAGAVAAEKAKSDADAILAEARAEATTIKNAALTAAKEKESSAAVAHDALLHKTAEAQSALDSMGSLLADKQKQLDTLNERIRTVKQQIAAIA